MNRDYMYYDLLDPPRNQHVFYDTYLDYARILLANLEAHRLHVHPMLTGTHVSAASWRAGASTAVERRTRQGRSFGIDGPDWAKTGLEEGLVRATVDLPVHDRQQGERVESGGSEQE